MMKRIFTLLACCATLGVAAQDEPTLMTSAQAKTWYQSSSKRRVSVHDPSVVYDAKAKRYYIIGSHRGVAYTADMQNWSGASETFARVNADGSTTQLATTGSQMEANLKQIFATHRTKTITKGGQEVAFGNYDATDWVCALPDEEGNAWAINGVMWAPDMVWNPVMQKWCQYLSLNGQAWNSVIVLLTADNLTGPWVYEGPVVYSGFRSPTDARVSWKKTDLELVIGEQSSLPTRYNHTSSANGQMWGDWWPNNIDPCVFYDEQGELWLCYGSWSGGIWMLKLNKQNGLRDYDTTYPSSGYSASAKNVTSDPYFGKKIAGGCYVSGEGPYIEHIGQYYYLFMSYGGFAPDGGYEMRVFRSANPDGPYTDAQGRSAIFSQWVLNYGGANADKRGEKILGSYNGWGFQTVGECAQGHNSIIVAEDGRTYLIYHTKFNDGTIGHQVRVHQVFVNEDGWLVAAPFEYNGEQVTDQDIAQKQAFSAEEVAGTYQVLVHKYAMDHANMEEVTPVSVRLTADGKVSGAYSGVWSLGEGNSYINLTMGGVAYKGVVLDEVMDQQTLHAVAFTAAAKSGVCVWGYKYRADHALAWQLNNQTVPVKAAASVSGHVDLMSVDLGVGCQVEWTSSAPDIISATGRYNPAGLEQDSTVRLTMLITSGNYYYQYTYRVKAKAETQPEGDYLTGMVAHYGFDETPCVNSRNADERALLLRSGTNDVPTLMDGGIRNGKVIHTNFGASGQNSYVRMPNPLKDAALSEGMTLSFWTRRADNNLWDALAAFYNPTAGSRFYVTGNSYIGFNNNDNNQNWLDLNHPDNVQPTWLSAGQWHLVTIVVSPTEGVKLYTDGTLRRFSKVAGNKAGVAVTSADAFDHALLLSHVASCNYLYLGYGSFWGSADASFDDVIVYNRALSDVDVQALSTMSNRVYYFETLSPVSQGIETMTVAAPQQRSGVYSLTGVRLGSSLDELPRGLYIVNGRKVLKR